MASVPTKVLKVGGKFGSYGEDGATFTPHLKDDGENITISYTNDKGLDNPAPITFKKTALPKVTTADNGKILIVENGEIIFAEIDVDAKAPVFDLAALGLSAVPLTGGSSNLATDTAAIRAALDNGAVAFVIPFSVGGATLNANIVMNAASVNGDYQSVIVVNYVAPGVVMVNINANGISVTCASLSEYISTPVPIAIDLSGFESEGKIVETFADGSTETTVMEFDADGKPTKITDGNGNVTVLTW